METKVMMRKNYNKNVQIWNRGLRIIFGCSNCDSENIHFAHVKPTKLTGIGRGLNKRFYDIINNFDCYDTLCKLCHRELDKKRRETNERKNKN